MDQITEISTGITRPNSILLQLLIPHRIGFELNDKKYLFKAYGTPGEIKGSSLYLPKGFFFKNPSDSFLEQVAKEGAIKNLDGLSDDEKKYFETFNPEYPGFKFAKLMDEKFPKNPRGFSTSFALTLYECGLLDSKNNYIQLFLKDIKLGDGLIVEQLQLYVK